MNCKEKLLEVRDIHKVYTKEGVPTKALNGITFDVLDGEFLGIMGASGSGKTTLLNCIATVIKPTSGQVLLSGANVSSFDSEKLAEYRGNKIGYLFQDFALLDNLTGRENILLPLSLGKNRKPDKERITYLTELLGIQNMLSEYPANLSGGEQRRVSIARTFAQNPKLVVADEPTSSLDMENSEIIMKYFQKMAKEGTTILVSTHDREFVNYADRCLWMKKGKLEKRELE